MPGVAFARREPHRRAVARSDCTHRGRLGRRERSARHRRARPPARGQRGPSGVLTAHTFRPLVDAVRATRTRPANSKSAATLSGSIDGEFVRHREEPDVDRYGSARGVSRVSESSMQRRRRRPNPKSSSMEAPVVGSRQTRALGTGRGTAQRTGVVFHQRGSGATPWHHVAPLMTGRQTRRSSLRRAAHRASGFGSCATRPFPSGSSPAPGARRRRAVLEPAPSLRRHLRRPLGEGALAAPSRGLQRPLSPHGSPRSDPGGAARGQRTSDAHRGTPGRRWISLCAARPAPGNCGPHWRRAPHPAGPRRYGDCR